MPLVTARSAAAQRWVHAFSEGSRDMMALLGGKGANLAELQRLGVPVPPGFVITTEACRSFLIEDTLPEGLVDQISSELRVLEQSLGRRFGDPEDPLLVSVRSGAPVSMPGMMDTILNVGLGRETIDGFARTVGDRGVARQCLIRLMSMYATAVGGVDGDAIAGASGDSELPDEPALSVAEERFEREVGAPFPGDPHEQLSQSVAAVFRSWNSKRARLYRRYHGIADTGTAVVVQAMVFGNVGSRSGTGVLFTRDPSTGDRSPFGDYLAEAQGEDVVAGSRNTDDLTGMRRAVPSAHEELLHVADLIERHFGDMCEIEFTVEEGRLWVLQSRAGQRSARASVRIAVQLAREGIITPADAIARVDVDELDRLLHPHLDRERLSAGHVLTEGIGSSPGLATGQIALDGERAAEVAAKGEPVVLVRTETRPDDLEGILASNGLLTTRGGKTSHAAVVTRGLGRPCVCGAEAITIDERQRLLRIDGVELSEGETISLDGATGLVIRGSAPVVTPTPPEETAQLLAWSDDARDLRVAAIATVAERIRVAVDMGADEIVVGLAGGVEDPASLIPAAVEAAGSCPLSVLTSGDISEAAGREALERIVDALAGTGSTAPLIVPAETWQSATALAHSRAPDVSVRAYASLDEDPPSGMPIEAVRWDSQAVPAGGWGEPGTASPSLALLPDLTDTSLDLARRLGVRAAIVQPDYVAAARLATAKRASAAST